MPEALLNISSDIRMNLAISSLLTSTVPSKKNPIPRVRPLLDDDAGWAETIPSPRQPLGVRVSPWVGTSFLIFS